MAFLFGDTFDLYDTANITAKWANTSVTGTTGGSVTVNASGRNSTSALRIITGGGNAGTSNIFAQSRYLAPGSATCIMGFAFKFSAVSTRNLSIAAIYDNAGTLQCSLGITPTGVLVMHRGSTAAGVLLATGTTILSASAFNYIEWKVLLNTTTGTFEVKINGTSEFSGSSANTAAAATNNWGSVAVGVVLMTNSYATTTWDFDDLYVLDSSGSVNNDYWGDVRGVGQLPSTGNGSNTDFTPSTGTDHGALVDENPPNTSDYNSSNTPGQRDTYNYPSLGLTGTVKGVQTMLYAAKSDAGTRTMARVHRISGVNYDGTAKAVGTSYAYLLQCDDVSPATSVAFTTGEINGMETGAKLVV